MSDDARLERIENEIKEIGRAIVSLARVEERLITLFKRMETFDTEQRAHASRLTEVERSSGTNGHMLRFGERVFWIVITAGIAFAFNKSKGG